MTEKTETRTHLFVGLPIPPAAKALLAKSLSGYHDSVQEAVPAANWHLTLIFLGEVKDYQSYLTKLGPALVHAFVPTASITHVGQGVAPNQLWAYINPTTGLIALKEEVARYLSAAGLDWPQDKIQHFIPHIKLAQLASGTNKIGVPDRAVNHTFTIREAHIYRSDQSEDGRKYSVVSKIYLTP